MSKKSNLGMITTTLSVLGINAVPAAGFLGLGWGWGTTMLLYLLENLAGILLPFIGLKTMVDVGQPIQVLLERRKPATN